MTHPYATANTKIRIPTVREESPPSFLNKRPRRNRRTEALRALTQETSLQPCQLVSPCFVLEGERRQEEISSMPGIHRLSTDLLIESIRTQWDLGIRAVDLFAYIPTEKKNPKGSEAVRPGNLICQAVHAVKQEFPELCVMVDVALDPYTDHGHDGLLETTGLVDNDRTLPLLAEMSLLAAEAGADVIAPSDMMDGRVAYIRKALDRAGKNHVAILAYTAKYASSFYGPFRDALGSSPQSGDKKNYQMNPANAREALLEAQLDEEEGADLLLVKPALAYLDIVQRMRTQTSLPIGAYHVSGEYAMVMAAAEKGWLDPDKVFHESLLSIRRAGADFILTYAAETVAKNILTQ